jgi:hypothetical protein
MSSSCLRTREERKISHEKQKSAGGRETWEQHEKEPLCCPLPTHVLKSEVAVVVLSVILSVLIACCFRTLPAQDHVTPSLHVVWQLCLEAGDRKTVYSVWKETDRSLLHGRSLLADKRSGQYLEDLLLFFLWGLTTTFGESIRNNDSCWFILLN